MSAKSIPQDPSVIDTARKELTDSILIFLRYFDDCIQDAADKGIDTSEYDSAYHQMEAYHSQVKAGENVNEISVRSLAKHIYKLSCVEIYWE